MTGEKAGRWYSWIVVGICFVVYFMNVGISRMSGLFFTDFIFYQKIDREQAVKPFLLAAVSRAICGPVNGYLSHTFGFRFSVVLGCSLSFLGIFACSFVKDITSICVFWSIFGFGLGMSTSILPRVINLYCKNHASKAIGIALAGASTAGIILPFVTVALLNTYGMPGTFLNLSAIMLNTIPCAILLRDPSNETLKDSMKEKKLEKCAENKSMLKEDKGPSGSLKMGMQEKASSVQYNEKYATLEESSTVIHCAGRVTTQRNENELENVTLDASEVSNTDLLANKQPKNSGNRGSNCMNLISIFWYPPFITISVLKSFCVFLIIIVSAIIVDFTIDKGVPKSKASYVLVAHSVSDLFGKACLGWITDGKYVSVVRYASLWFCIVAFAFALMVWSNGFAVMVVATILVGTGVAAVLPTLFVFFNQYFEKDKQSMAIASAEIFLLPLCFVTAPLIGYFRDGLGSYNGLAYTLGAASLVCSVLVLLIPSFSRWRVKKTENISDI